ncbi:transposase [Acetobacter tropicalis]|uniref:Transposase n=1 Tax=Acetobacter tropicalis TaxID=104102 RepID=A0A252AA75_9PROT|nr:transposase [Acetobacter tropicalis]
MLPGKASVPGVNAEAVIPSKRNRKVFIPHNQALYKDQNRIERCVNHLKHCRRFATRYDRSIIHFAGFLYFAAAMIWIACNVD